MKLDPRVLRCHIDEKFSGNLLYMPIHDDGSKDARPVMQLTLDPTIPDRQDTPRSLMRVSSALHLAGILHHQPGRK